MNVYAIANRTKFSLIFCALTFSSLGFGGAAQAGALNDTGVTSCSNGTATVACSSVDATLPGQDASFGRDAAAATGALTKVGSGPAGFDFTKLDIGGAVVPDSAVMGSAAGQHACTRDNVTGLVWDVLLASTGNASTAGGSYGAWSDPNSATNGGDPGTSNTSPPNTSTRVISANAANQCGGTGWRLPTVRELLTTVNMGQGNRPPGYFSVNTVNISYCSQYNGVAWSSQSVRGNSAAAWLVSQNGQVFQLAKLSYFFNSTCYSSNYPLYVFVMIVR